MSEIDAAFRAAVLTDHPCDDNHCDIPAALRAGCPRVAAYLLTGATECPAVRAVAAETGDDWSRLGNDDPDWLGWVEWFHANTAPCWGCGAYVFTDLGARSCDNCGAVL